MCVAHTCLCTSMLAHHVSCTQRMHEWSNDSGKRTWPYLSRLQGYMVPSKPGKVARDLMRNVGDMFQGVVHDIPVSSFPIPMLISKGPKEGQRSSDIRSHINSGSKWKKNSSARGGNRNCSSCSSISRGSISGSSCSSRSKLIPTVEVSMVFPYPGVVMRSALYCCSCL